MVMLLVWCIGCVKMWYYLWDEGNWMDWFGYRFIVGFMIGGWFVKFVEGFLGCFLCDGIFGIFFYLFFNFFSVICVFIGVIVGFLFFEEIYVERKYWYDFGIELGWFLMFWIWGFEKVEENKGKLLVKVVLEEEWFLLLENDELLFGYWMGFVWLLLFLDIVLEELFDFEEGGGFELVEVERVFVGKVFFWVVIMVIIFYGIFVLYVFCVWKSDDMMLILFLVI